jgi:hypothetical protein
MDMGLGQPLEHVLRSWLIAARLADRPDVEPGARTCLYYVMMLAWVGCIADTAEVAAGSATTSPTGTTATALTWPVCR